MTTIHHGDCIETMNAMPPESVDAIVTDPPYGLGFMGKKWDGLPPSLEWAEACYRVLKPGGHIAAFGGTRTWHRLAVAIEDAGFEMRDSLAWLYGSGFPKSMNVGKAIDKLAGAEREVIGRKGGRYAYRHNPEKASHAPNGMFRWGDRHYAWTDLPPNAREFFTKAAAEKGNITAPATPEAQQWDGWGTALKPAFEPIVLARKPLAEKTVARNVLAHGTGAINIDGCRIEGEANRPTPSTSHGGSFLRDGCRTEAELRALAEAGEKTPYGRDARATLARYEANGARREEGGEKTTNTGRWPANVLLDQHAAAWVDEQSGIAPAKAGRTGKRGGSSWHGQKGFGSPNEVGTWPADPGGGASRFFYSAKAPKSERPNVNGVQHSTVKPLKIMRWLIRLVTPPGGTVLDPFAGSGTTIEAALIEGFNPVGIEMEAEYLPLIQHRIDRQAGTLTD